MYTYFTSIVLRRYIMLFVVWNIETISLKSVIMFINQLSYIRTYTCSTVFYGLAGICTWRGEWNMCYHISLLVISCDTLCDVMWDCVLSCVALCDVMWRIYDVMWHCILSHDTLWCHWSFCLVVCTVVQAVCVWCLSPITPTYSGTPKECHQS